MEIRILKKSEIEKDALGLVKRVFDEFDAPYYTEEGVKTFDRFIQPNNILRMVKCKSMDIWGAFEEDVLTGVLAVEAVNHICLFYVDGKYHKRGIASALFERMLDDTGNKEITVRAAPYATGFYHKKGFKDTAGMTEENGLVFTPMKFTK